MSLRTGCSMLGCLEPELTFDQQIDATERMLAVFPGILLYWYHFAKNGTRMEPHSDSASIAGHFLHLLHGKPPAELIIGELAERAMDVSLILYAEHEFNASTFSARVCTATLSDIHSAITGAIGTLRGKLHGGANEAALDLIEQFDDADAAENGIREMLARKELIMGFGHRVYREFDPRNVVIKSWAKRLADCSQDQSDQSLYEVSERIEKVMWDEKRLFPKPRLLQCFCVCNAGHSEISFHSDFRLRARCRVGSARI